MDIPLFKQVHIPQAFKIAQQLHSREHRHETNPKKSLTMLLNQWRMQGSAIKRERGHKVGRGIDSPLATTRTKREALRKKKEAREEGSDSHAQNWTFMEFHTSRTCSHFQWVWSKNFRFNEEGRSKEMWEEWQSCIEQGTFMEFH